MHVSCRDRRRGIKLPEEVVECLLLHTGRARVVIADDLVQRNVLDLSANNFAILDMLLVVCLNRILLARASRLRPDLTIGGSAAQS